MKLREHHPPPGAGQIGAGSAALRHQRRLVQLQRALERAEVRLHAALGGERAAVVLEVDFTVEGGQLRALGREPVEERLRLVPLQGGQPAQRREPAGALAQVLARPAAAVAPAVGHQEFIVHVALLVLVRGGAQLLDRERVVELHALGHVADHGVSAGAAPDKAGVGEAVDGVPRGLGGEEIVHAAEPHQLRQAGAEAEEVGQPQDARAAAGEPRERRLAEDECAGQALAAGDVRVTLHVHPAGRLPLAGAQARTHGAMQGRRAALHGLVARSLRVGEAELGIECHEPVRVRECVHGLALADLLGPEPDEVEVRVAGEGGASERARVAQLAVERGEGAPQRGDAGGVEGVQRGIEPAQQAAVQRGDVGERRLLRHAVELAEHAGVLAGAQLEHPVVEAGEIVIGGPGLVVAVPELGAAEEVARGAEALGFRMPDGGLHAEALDPDLAHAGGKLDGAVGDIEAVERRVADEQRGLALLVPVEPAAAAGRKDHAAPALVVEPAPRLAIAHGPAREFLGRSEGHVVRAAGGGLDADGPRVVPDQLGQAGDAALQAEGRELDEGIEGQHRGQFQAGRRRGKVKVEGSRCAARQTPRREMAAGRREGDEAVSLARSPRLASPLSR